VTLSNTSTRAPYLAMFRQHRRLLMAPIVIALLVALWVVLTSPPSYTATANVWTAQTVQTDPTPTVPIDPTLRNSAIGQQVLQELLSTRTFRLAVGRRGPLTEYLRHHDSVGFGPRGLLMRLKGSQPLDDRVVAALSGKHVLMAVAGPDVLSIAFHGPTSSVATGTLKALLAQFTEQDAANRQAQERATSNYFSGLVDSASNRVAAAQAALTQYLANHPSNGHTDAAVQPLSQAVSNAQSELLDATNNFNTAQRALVANGPNYRIVDPPHLTGSSGGKVKDLMAMGTGLVLGVVISLLGLAALVSRARKAETTAETVALAPVADVVTMVVEPESTSEAATAKWNGNGTGSVGTASKTRGAPAASMAALPDDAGAPVKSADATTNDATAHASAKATVPTKRSTPAVARRRKTGNGTRMNTAAKRAASDTRPGSGS
jgi:hypothetical protein